MEPALVGSLNPPRQFRLDVTKVYAVFKVVDVVPRQGRGDAARSSGAPMCAALKRGRALDEGNLDEVGAVLCAIVRLTSDSGGLDEEDKRAVYSLSCIALAEWRKLDASIEAGVIRDVRERT